MEINEKIHLLMVDDEEKFLKTITERLKLKFFQNQIKLLSKKVI